jgi:putative hydrolase of the HAD superfamily
VISHWLFDLDNTLYPRSSGLFALVNERISLFMVSRLGLPLETVPALRERYWKEYGLTLGGLMAHHGVEPGEYLQYVHDVPLQDFLVPDPALADALRSLPGEKVVFTNGSAAHARAVLVQLGVDRLISRVFDIEAMEYVPKPRPHGYRRLLQSLGAVPREAWMIDDLLENLETARALGLTTVLVREEPAANHLHARSVLEVPGLYRAHGGRQERSAPECAEVPARATRNLPT